MPNSAKGIIGRLLAVSTVLLLFVWAPAKVRAEGAAVYISGSGNDAVGARLIFQIREHLRAANGMRLVATEEESAFQIRIVTIDPTDDKLSTVYSAVFTISDPSNQYRKIYWNNVVGICGSGRLKECSEGLAADLDQMIVTMQAVLARQIRDAMQRE